MPHDTVNCRPSVQSLSLLQHCTVVVAAAASHLPHLRTIVLDFAGRLRMRCHDWILFSSYLSICVCGDCVLFISVVMFVVFFICGDYDLFMSVVICFYL